jgi:hypothetical protein
VLCGPLVAGCGAATRVDFASHSRPASPVDVSVYVGTGGITLDPRRVRSGPVELLITNQTDAAHALHVSAAGGRTIYSSARPTPAGATAQLKLTLGSGTYELGVDGRSPSPQLHVSGPVRSGDNELTQP